MKPKQTQTLFLKFSVDLISLLVSGGYILGDKTVARPACACLFAGQSFEGVSICWHIR